MGKALGTLLKFATGEGKSFVKDIGGKIDRTMDAAERKIETVTARALKAASVFLFVFLGFIFALIGLAKYLTAYFAWEQGMGYLVVGVILILLGGFAKLVRP